MRYQRADGLDLNATLYLPPGYQRARDGPLPCLLWAYPREYKSRARACCWALLASDRERRRRGLPAHATLSVQRRAARLGDQSSRMRTRLRAVNSKIMHTRTL